MSRDCQLIQRSAFSPTLVQRSTSTAMTARATTANPNSNNNNNSLDNDNNSRAGEGRRWQRQQGGEQATGLETQCLEPRYVSIFYNCLFFSTNWTLFLPRCTIYATGGKMEGATMKTGPNNASGVVWATCKSFFPFPCFSLLNSILYSYINMTTQKHDEARKRAHDTQ